MPEPSPAGSADRLHAFRLPDPRQRLVDGDARQPGGEPGTRLELIQVEEGVDVGLLPDVLGFVVTADDGPGDAEQPLVVPPHQRFELRRVTGAHGLYELFVGHAGPRRGNGALH